MAKYSNDFDSVFMMLKKRHNRFFISVINKSLEKNYPLDAHVELFPTDGQLVTPENESVDIEDRESDMLIIINGDKYLVECQSYDDDTMAIRIAEYAFITARDTAEYEEGRITFKMPAYIIIYIQSSAKTPTYTKINFEFPNGDTVTYDSKNIFVSDYSREDLIKYRLFVLIPYYIVRYKKILKNDKNNDNEFIQIIEDLEYFNRELDMLTKNGTLTSEEYVNLVDSTNIIIKHITDGNKNEERMVKIMGGRVLEPYSDQLIRQGYEQGLEQGREQGLQERIALESERNALEEENRQLKKQLEALTH